MVRNILRDQPYFFGTSISDQVKRRVRSQRTSSHRVRDEYIDCRVSPVVEQMSYYGNGANVVSTHCRNPVRLLCKTHTRTVVSMMSATTATVKPAEFVHCSPQKPISVEYRGRGRVK